MKIAYCIILLEIVIGIIAFGVYWVKRNQLLRTMMKLEEMIDSASKGDFQEKYFDESYLSKIETKMAHYLSSSEVSAKNLSDEKEKIKSLIGDISHQTKTPISNILLYSQLLKEQQLSIEGKSCVDALNNQAEKLSFLINALVKTSRLETGIMTVKPELANISDLLEEVVKQIEPKILMKNIHFSIQKTESQAYFDKKWTTEAVYNIVDNAVKYTQYEGEISIKVFPLDLYVRIDIEDNGIGIEEEEISKIFGRFYRSYSVKNEEGVGIGLFLSRQIINNEGGYIKVSSKPGEGSTFSIYLSTQKTEIFQ